MKPAESAGWCDLALEWYLVSSAALQPHQKSALRMVGWVLWVSSSGQMKLLCGWCVQKHGSRLCSGCSELSVSVSQWCVPAWFSKSICPGSLRPHMPTHMGQVPGTDLSLVTRTLKHLVPKLSQRTDSLKYSYHHTSSTFSFTNRIRMETKSCFSQYTAHGA